MDIYEIRQALNSGKTIYDLNLKVTYYARVSTDKDEQRHSLAAQINYYEAFIHRCSNWSFVDGYIDEGISGTSVKHRENFLRMIEDARAHTFDFIITKEISRFSRNTMDSIWYTQELLKDGVGVLFQSDNINTLLPDSELRLTIMSSVAQEEVRKISERVKFGFKRAIEKGVVLGSSSIWGYQKQNGRLIIDEKEAEIVRTIFDLYANQRIGIRGISNTLTERGFVNQNGNAFSFSTIRGILTNPKYKGFYCGRKSTKIDYKLNTVKNFDRSEWVLYEDFENVPPIVSEKLWERANDILAKRSAKQSAKDRTSYQNKYPYSGKIRCGQHHEPYYRSLYHYKSGDKELWQCREYAKKGRRGCLSPILYTTEADQIVRLILREAAGEKNEIVEELIEIYTADNQNARMEAEAVRCKSTEEEITRRKDKLLDLSIEGKISGDEFEVRNQRFNQELERLRLQIDALRQEISSNLSLKKSPDGMRQAIEKELEFQKGFSVGLIESVLDRMEVYGTDDQNRVEIYVYLHGSKKRQKYLIERRRGAASVCYRQYI